MCCELFKNQNDVTLINGDCLEVMQQFKNESVDCIISDLPYEVLNCKWDKKIDFKQLWEQ